MTFRIRHYIPPYWTRVSFFSKYLNVYDQFHVYFKMIHISFLVMLLHLLYKRITLCTYIVIHTWIQSFYQCRLSKPASYSRYLLVKTSIKIRIHSAMKFRMWTNNYISQKPVELIHASCRILTYIKIEMAIPITNCLHNDRTCTGIIAGIGRSHVTQWNYFHNHSPTKIINKPEQNGMFLCWIALRICFILPWLMSARCCQLLPTITSNLTIQQCLF